MSNQKKMVQYASIINDAIVNLFEEDKLDLADFEDDSNTKAFLFALSVAVPTSIHNKLVGAESSRDYLQFNHISNHLCFEFCKSDDSKIEG